mmetsp:Transcript_18382/g.44266  ORF Transcript_18382/g.44266 Transcript_18382/m.44266 type:complete len:207 (-) Transcript_18382:845-1465(-)
MQQMIITRSPPSMLDVNLIGGRLLLLPLLHLLHAARVRRQRIRSSLPLRNLHHTTVGRQQRIIRSSVNLLRGRLLLLPPLHLLHAACARGQRIRSFLSLHYYLLHTAVGRQQRRIIATRSPPSLLGVDLLGGRRRVIDRQSLLRQHELLLLLPTSIPLQDDLPCPVHLGTAVCCARSTIHIASDDCAGAANVNILEEPTVTAVVRF